MNKVQKIISIDIYRRDVFLVVNHSHKELEVELMKYLSKGEVKRTMKACREIQRDGAITVLHGNGGVLVYLPIYHGNESGIAKLAHEMLHAASFIIEETGMSFSHHTQEAYAHLLEYLMSESMKALNHIKE